MSPCLALLAACVLIAPVAAADRVELSGGTVLEGRVVCDTREKVVLRQGSKDRVVPAAEVRNVRSLERSLAELLRRYEAAPGMTAGARLDLARFAAGEGLLGEAHLFALGALALDAECAPAHELLGHEFVRGVWCVRERRRAVPFSELADLRSDWTSAWRLSTLHYDLRTNLPLETAFHVALELEQLYRAFFARFRAELDLYDVVEPMAAQVHADRRSYPGGDGRAGFYDVDIDTLMQRADEGFSPQILAHEGTHQLLANTAERTLTAKGDIPGWLNEGLADTIAFSRRGTLGRAEYVPDARGDFYFRIHAGAPNPYELSRVMTLNAADFSISSHVALAYAQSYTLVQFCLEGENRRYRPGFFEYMRRCYAGSPAMTSFKAALGIDEEEFEAAWHAFAQAGP